MINKGLIEQKIATYSEKVHRLVTTPIALIPLQGRGT